MSTGYFIVYSVKPFIQYLNKDKLKVPKSFIAIIYQKNYEFKNLLLYKMYYFCQLYMTSTLISQLILRLLWYSINKGCWRVVLHVDCHRKLLIYIEWKFKWLFVTIKLSQLLTFIKQGIVNDLNGSTLHSIKQWLVNFSFYIILINI